MTDLAGKYRGELATLHTQALGRYLTKRDDRTSRDLDSIERGMMKFPRGVPPGLITADQARARATPEGLVKLQELGEVIAPRIRDEFKVVPDSDWADAVEAKKKDGAPNRGLIRLTLDQNGHGSCASEGMGGCTMFCEAKQGLAVEKLNALGLYRLVNGGRDGGSSLSDNLAAAMRYGIPTERVWPRSKGWRTSLSDEAKRDALRHRPQEVFRVSNRLEFGTALLLGFVVYAGYSGHAWYATDLIDSRRFYWKNSWGSDWGSDGFGTLNFNQLQWGYGCWAVRTARRAGMLHHLIRMQAIHENP
jgi:hypothetical protein